MSDEMARAGTDAGSGTVNAVGIIAALLTATVGALAVLSAVHAVHTARAAADLGALAAAVDHQEGGGAGCAEAVRVAALHEVDVTRCTIDAAGVADVTTSAAIAFQVPGVTPARAEGRARAGPVEVG